MKWLRWHPGDRLLNRFADGALAEHEHGDIAAHLADCPRCREEVALVRRMGDVARTIPGPIATDEVLRRALARRAAGERVLLPMSDAGAPVRRPARRFAPAAVAAMLTLMVASLVMSVRVLEADRPALRLSPERPTAGEVLRAEYHGGALFDDQAHLALRARYRTAGDRQWQLLAGVLVRGEDGLYRTELELPDSVVYAAFAVEDMDFERLDSNNRELWDVMIHGPDGRPTLGAMTARLRDLERRDWGAAYAMARAMTEAYPDEPQSWAIRFSYELPLFDQDSVRAAHRERFARLEAALSEAESPSPGSMAWLGVYGIDLGLHETAETWVRKALAAGPSLPAVIDAEVMWLQVEHVADPVAKLEALDTVWDRVGDGISRSLAHGGWRAAIEAEDSEAILKWSERYLPERPSEALRLIPAAALSPELRPQLVGQVRTFKTDPERWLEIDRPLRMPLQAHIRSESELIQHVLGESAVAMASSGDSEHARVLADLGIDLAWNSEALLTFARVLTGANEPERALEVLARVAADPATADSAAAEAWAPAGGPEWDLEVARARSELREHVLRDAIVRHLPDRATLSRDGSRVDFTALLHGRPTVVAFLARFCAPALDEVERLPGLRADLAELGADLIVIDIWDGTGLVGYLNAAGYTGPVYRDDRGEARSAFRSAATPDFFVMDEMGRIRFEHTSSSAVLRQVWALQGADPNPADVAEN